jgi:hypothetical protein
MPLLEIKATRKVSVLCTLEESTALQVNQYAAFAKEQGDDVVNKALEYAFSKDSEFQKYCVSNPNAPAALRVKKPASVSTGARRGPKQTSIAAD